MNKFLVLARPAKPLPEGANIQKAVDHLDSLREKMNAEVYTLVEDDGYGFAILIDVKTHDELMAELFKNPLGRWVPIRSIPWGPWKGSERPWRPSVRIQSVLSRPGEPEEDVKCRNTWSSTSRPHRFPRTPTSRVSGVLFLAGSKGKGENFSYRRYEGIRLRLRGVLP